MKSEYTHIVGSLIKKLRHLEGSGVALLPRAHPAARVALPPAAQTGPKETPASRPATRLVFAAPRPSGKNDEAELLDKIIAATGLKKDEVLVAYSQAPEHEVAGGLMDEVKAARPEAVIALGPEAAGQLAGLAGDFVGDFEGLRGRLHLVDGIKVLATSSIKSLVEDPAQKKRAWSEIKLVLNALGATPRA